MSDKKQPPVKKTKEERVKEGMELLRKLTEVGVSRYVLGWKEVQETVAEWVRDGESLYKKIKFPTMGRIAEITLPSRADREANLWFRVAPN